MSKKQKAVEAELQEEESKKQDQISEGIVKDSKKKEKTAKDGKDKKKDNKKNKKDKKAGIGKKAKETVSELKKVTWPSFGEVVKKTGIVIAFVIIFGLFIFGINTLLGWLAGLLVG